MQRGTKPKPTRLKALEGNPGRRPLPQNEPVVEEPLGSAPDNWPGVAKELWTEVAGEVPFGVASKADRIAFEILVRLIAKVRAAPDKLTPAMAAQIRSACAEFGMTPSSRSRLSIGLPKPRSKFDGLLGGCS